MKKLKLSAFEAFETNLATSSKISGGYEGSTSETASCTAKTTGTYGNLDGDTNTDGDWYSSC